VNQSVPFRHVDVFADKPYRGNGLIVMFCRTLDYGAGELRAIAEEMRQFETIFVRSGDDSRTIAARIFTIEEELPFAGHPVIGAASALHERLVRDTDSVNWTFVIAGRSIPVVSRRDSEYFSATMDQGRPVLGPTVHDLRYQFAGALNLAPEHIAPLPVQVVSTGLPYLIVPVTGDGLRRARIVGPTFEEQLADVGAKFVYVLDIHRREGRTWDNAGAVEDVATGSAAGPAAAYLHEHALLTRDEPLHLRQGSFLGRSSTITVTRDGEGHLWVGGPVRPVATGWLEAVPEPAGRPMGLGDDAP
jgi:trans-2,3-dihydro-3-hydroxyanthranilate isomerase